MSAFFDPFTLMSSSVAFWAESSQALQKQYISTVTHMIEQSTQSLNGANMGGASSEVARSGSEAYLQDVFQTAANINLGAWTHTANMLAAMPDWMQWSTQAPERAMASLFEVYK